LVGTVGKAFPFLRLFLPPFLAIFGELSIKPYKNMAHNTHISQLQAAFEALKVANLQLDMTRGKPSPEQLDLTVDMLKISDYRSSAGTDARNYGMLDGLPVAKQFFAEYMEVTPEEVVVGGNSSLQLMHDTIVNAMLHGVPGGEQPWGKQPIKFLCPVPGYDRHFGVCEHLGIEMVNIPTDATGPDMDLVEKLCAEDGSIKGMWCVPKYSNPTGVTYAPETVERLAKMKAAPDFRIMWDNAYAAHHLYPEHDELPNLLRLCQQHGHAQRAFMFGSTSKITFAGAGVGVFAADAANIAWFKSHLFFQTIGYDKLNQLRHVQFFGKVENLQKHMERHAEILRPKFEKVLEVLERELSGMATWSRPKGGYFISLDVPEGCAKRTVDLAAELGVKLTAAGATFPYKTDPEDRNIRIAPSLPSLPEIEKATEVLCLCVKMAAAGQ